MKKKRRHHTKGFYKQKVQGRKLPRNFGGKVEESLNSTFQPWLDDFSRVPGIKGHPSGHHCWRCENKRHFKMSIKL